MYSTKELTFHLSQITYCSSHMFTVFVAFTLALIQLLLNITNWICPFLMLLMPVVHLRSLTVSFNLHFTISRYILDIWKCILTSRNYFSDLLFKISSIALWLVWRRYLLTDSNQSEIFCNDVTEIIKLFCHLLFIMTGFDFTDFHRALTRSQIIKLEIWLNKITFWLVRINLWVVWKNSWEIWERISLIVVMTIQSNRKLTFCSTLSVHMWKFINDKTVDQKNKYKSLSLTIPVELQLTIVFNIDKLFLINRFSSKVASLNALFCPTDHRHSVSWDRRRKLAGFLIKIKWFSTVIRNSYYSECH